MPPDQNEPKLYLLMGASRGMGAAIAQKMAAEGNSLILAARNHAALSEVVGSCKAAAPSVKQVFETASIDFMADSSPETLAQAVAGRRLAGVLVNGGGPHGDQVTDISPQELEDAHRLLFRGPVLHLQAVLPCLAEGAQILALTSTTVLEPHPALTLSGAYRNALTSYLKSLADALGTRGISVNSLAPGFVDTDRLATLRRHESARLKTSENDVIALWAAKAVLKRIASPEEIANMAAFLLQGRCPFLTGQVIVVDGGQVRAVH